MFVGNDIVDLHDKFNAQSFINEAYLKKIASQHEIESFETLSPHTTATIWAFKESAYKYISKVMEVKPFNPRNYKITQTKAFTNNIVNSTVFYIPGNCFIYSCAYITGNYIHAISTTGSEALQHVKKKSIRLHTNDPGIQSANLKKLFIEDISKEYNVNTSQCKLIKTKTNIPILFIDGERTIDLSFSHDGQFMAYAYIESNI